MKNINILVLGNGPQINDIHFNRLSPNIITLGINRIWLAHIPHYFFFNDLIISNELLSYPDTLESLKKNSIIFSSDWIKKGKHSSSLIPSWTQVHLRENKFIFPDSVTNSIEIIKTKYLKNYNCTFYLAGIPLTWSEPSHFWKTLNYSSKNNENNSWYSSRFDKIFDNFKTLKNKKYNIISVSPNSKLNKLFRYENIENLYSKL